LAEVVFSAQSVVADRCTYRARVCGRPAGHVWEGWIEFEGPAAEVLRTERETTQPNRDALIYWASGLSATYLEGAVARASNRSAIAAREFVAAPHFDEPAPASTGEPVVPRRAVLDPFAVAEKGVTLLRQELGALHAWRLRDVIRAHELADASVNLEILTHAALVELIVRRVAL